MGNTNIHDEHLGKKGLHLNGRGTGEISAKYNVTDHATLAIK